VTSRLQNTSDSYHYSVWVDQQKAFIASLRSQPLLVVLRAKQEDLEEPFSNKSLFSLIEELSCQGVRHVEIAWSSHSRWIPLMTELNSSFVNISLGAASLKNTNALESVAAIGLDYATTPIWHPQLQLKARKLKQLLIPGVFSPTEIQEAKSFGCQLIKLFPSSSLGIKYIKHLQDPLEPLPFIIASGGLNVNDINPWLGQGYGAIALGRELIRNHQIDPKLQRWLKGQRDKI